MVCDSKYDSAHNVQSFHNSSEMIIDEYNEAVSNEI